MSTSENGLLAAAREKFRPGMRLQPTGARAVTVTAVLSCAERFPGGSCQPNYSCGGAHVRFVDWAGRSESEWLSIVERWGSPSPPSPPPSTPTAVDWSKAKVGDSVHFTEKSPVIEWRGKSGTIADIVSPGASFASFGIMIDGRRIPCSTAFSLIGADLLPAQAEAESLVGTRWRSRYSGETWRVESHGDDHRSVNMVSEADGFARCFYSASVLRDYERLEGPPTIICDDCNDFHDAPECGTPKTSSAPEAGGIPEPAAAPRESGDWRTAALVAPAGADPVAWRRAVGFLFDNAEAQPTRWGVDALAVLDDLRSVVSGGGAKLGGDSFLLMGKALAIYRTAVSTPAPANFVRRCDRVQTPWSVYEVPE